MSAELVKAEKPSNGKGGTILVIGGGIALLAYLISRLGFGGPFGLGGGSSEPQDESRITLILHIDGFLYLGTKAFTLENAIHRVLDGGRKDVQLLVTGDTPQGIYDSTLKAFKLAGITVYQEDKK